MRFPTFILSTLCAVTCVLAENVSVATNTSELLEALQKAPTRLARLNVLKDNKDVNISYRSPVIVQASRVSVVVVRLHFWHWDHQERRRQHHRR